MGKIFGVLTNPWTVSIVTGLIVFFITEFIKRYRGKKEHLRKVEFANEEVLGILKMIIPEKNLPPIEILLSIHKSAAKKYNIKLSEMNSLSVIFDDLIKEIMETNFISYSTKTEYNNEIYKKNLEYTRFLSEAEKQKSKEVKDEARENMYFERRVISLFASLLISVITMMISITFLMYKKQDKLLESFIFFPFNNNVGGLIISLWLAMLAIILLAFTVTRLKKRELERRRREEKKLTRQQLLKEIKDMHS